MTPEQAAALVERWVRLYTRSLPAHVAERRIEEMAADLHDHVAYERGRGTADWHIALSILSRMARGMQADLSWSGSANRLTGDLMKPFVAALAIALGIAVIALVLDSPLLVLLSIAVIVGVTTGTFALSVRSAYRAGFVVPFVAIVAGALAVAALGVFAIVFGDRGDAPGLVLLGIVVITSVIVGAFALGVRRAQRTM